MNGGRPVGTKRFKRRPRKQPEKQGEATPPITPTTRKSASEWLGNVVTAVLALLGIALLLTVVSCIASIFSCVGEGARTLDKKFEQVQAEMSQEQEEGEKEEPDTGLAWAEPSLAIEWHEKYNHKTAKERGWEMRESKNMTSSGLFGYEGPVLNTDFMAGQAFVFTPQSGNRMMYEVRLRCRSSKEDKLSENLAVIDAMAESCWVKVTEANAGLVYLYTEPAMMGLTKRPQLDFAVTWKNAGATTGRFAYWRKFAPQKSGEMDTAEWVWLPLQVKDPDKPKEPQRVGFDVCIHLSRPIGEGEAVKEFPWPDRNDLKATPVLVSATADSGEVIKQWEMDSPLLKITSQGVRNFVQEAKVSLDTCRCVKLAIASAWPLRVDATVRFRGKDVKGD